MKHLEQNSEVISCCLEFFKLVDIGLLNYCFLLPPSPPVEEHSIGGRVKKSGIRVKSEKMWDSLGVNPAFFLEFFRGQTEIAWNY